MTDALTPPDRRRRAVVAIGAAAAASLLLAVPVLLDFPGRATGAMHLAERSDQVDDGTPIGLRAATSEGAAPLPTLAGGPAAVPTGSATVPATSPPPGLPISPGSTRVPGLPAIPTAPGSAPVQVSGPCQRALAPAGHVGSTMDTQGLWAVDAATGQTRLEIADAVGQLWASPDGHHVLFDEADDPDSLSSPVYACLADLRARTVQTLVAWPDSGGATYVLNGAAWFPDGSRVLATLDTPGGGSTRTAANSAVVIDAASGAITTLWGQGCPLPAYAVAPDSRTVALTCSTADPDKETLQTGPWDGPAPRAVPAGASSGDSTVLQDGGWSPDGSRLVTQHGFTVEVDDRGGKTVSSTSVPADGLYGTVGRIGWAADGRTVYLERLDSAGHAEQTALDTGTGATRAVDYGWGPQDATGTRTAVAPAGLEQDAALAFYRPDDGSLLRTVRTSDRPADEGGFSFYGSLSRPVWDAAGTSVQVVLVWVRGCSCSSVH